MSLPKPAISAVFALLLPHLAGAQFAQYTRPGGAGSEPRQARQRLEEAVDKARFRLGPIRLAPWLSIHDLGFQKNVFATEGGTGSDLTATAGLGFRAYLPAGRKVTWVASALPEYVWWRDATDRRRFNGRYGLAVFAFGNRLTFEASARRVEQAGFVTSEVLQRINSRRDESRAALTVDLAQRLSLFAEGSAARYESLLGSDPDPRLARFDALDRDEDVVRGGLRLGLPSGWSLGVGVERSRVDFLSSSLDRSNSGTSPILELERREGRLTLRADLADRSLDPDAGSRFVPFRRVTGGAHVAWKLPHRLLLTVAASRNLVYSLEAAYAYFVSDRASLSLDGRFGRRSLVHLLYESGANDYTALAAETPGRRDDVATWGGELRVEVTGSARFTVGGFRTRFDSNLPGFDRNVTLLTAGLTLGSGTASLWW